MSRVQTVTELVRAATVVGQIKVRTVAAEMRRAVCREVHVKQFEETEEDLAQALEPWFAEQIRQVEEDLGTLGRTIERGYKSPADTASNLVRQVFDPREYDEELINRALPVLARAAGEAARAQLILLGVNPGSGGERALDGTREPLSAKSTASEWLDRVDEELPPGLATELPESIKQEISRQLRDTFTQPYWTRIAESTRTDIEKFLEIGLRDGLSIRDMARNISDAFPSSYSRKRATLVARTESGHALNGARKGAVDVLKEEVPEVPMVQVWLSVLGFTTRDAHADLDGVPEDGDGLWNLNGVLIPWPSHTSLPAGDRAN